MKIFIDTNILISAALFPGSIPEKAYQKAVSYPNEAVISDMNLEELRRIFNKKFQDKVPLLSMFISILAVSVQIVRVPIRNIRKKRRSGMRRIDRFSERRSTVKRITFLKFLAPQIL